MEEVTESNVSEEIALANSDKKAEVYTIFGTLSRICYDAFVLDNKKMQSIIKRESITLKLL